MMRAVRLADKEITHYVYRQIQSWLLPFQLAHQNGEISAVMYHCHIFHCPLNAPFHLCFACLFLSSSWCSPSSSSVCLSSLVFPVYWTETCWYEARLHGHKGTSLWCFWSAARSDMSTAPPCTLQWLIMQYNGQAQTTKDAHPHTCSLCRSYNHEYTHTEAYIQTHTVQVLALLTAGWLVCWARGSEREMVCVIYPFLPPFFASDSKMDDCNHRSHQWDRVEVYGAVRHSHGKPAVRLLHRAAMGTLRCLFVWGFVVSYAFSSLFHLPSVWPFDVQSGETS